MSRSRDPITFFHDALGWTPWSRQIEIARSLHEAMEGGSPKRLAIRSGNAVGKTALAARLMLWALRCYDDAMVLTTAPTMRQVEQILWREARHAYHTAKFPLRGTFYDGQPRWDLAENRFALGLSPEKTHPETLHGYHAPTMLVIVDEASGISEAFWDAIKGITASGNAVIFAIGNPTRNAGEFYDAFHRTRHLWRGHRISAYDLPHLSHLDPVTGLSLSPAIPSVPVAASRWLAPVTPTTNVNPNEPTLETVIAREGPEPSSAEPEATSCTPPTTAVNEPPTAPSNPPLPGLVSLSAIHSALEEWGPTSPLYQVRILGDFPTQAEDAVISLDWIENAGLLYDTFDLSTLETASYYLGVDVARHGADETVLCLFRGNYLLRQEAYHQDTMKTAARIRCIYDDVIAGRPVSGPGDPVLHEPRFFTKLGPLGQSTWLQNMKKRERKLTIAIDDADSAGGMIDRLRELELPIRDVRFNHKPQTRKGDYFHDRGAEMYWNLREALKAGKLALPRDEKLWAQLTQLEWDMNSDKSIKVHKKGRNKDFRSPDRADALALAIEAQRQSTLIVGIWTGYD